MHEMERANMDQELVAQGLGNSIAGLLGAMPMTGVIIRSSANVKSGAKTRASTIIHGMFLLLISTLLCKQIELIPKCALSALLVHTGFNLVYRCPFEKIRKGGDRELVFYGLAVLVILMTDLLTGVLFGVILALANLSYKMLRMGSVVLSGSGNSVTVKLMGISGFTALTTLTPILEGIPPRHDVSIDITSLLHIDASCIGMIEQWERRYTAQGGTVSVSWKELEIRKKLYVDRLIEEEYNNRSYSPRVRHSKESMISMGSMSSLDISPHPDRAHFVACAL
jgi:MFS superfamily sulfate permease-like transporter